MRLIQEKVLDQNSNDEICHKNNDYIENGYQCLEINEINRVSRAFGNNKLKR